MAAPRVFISSTFYDLRHVREDLERFVRELGYESVRNETGGVPYGKDQPPEHYAYQELALCDIVVSVIGGRFGTESQQHRGYSISQAELRRAIERGIQVFIFVEQSVWSEFSTYRLNREATAIKYCFVDDVRVFRFLDEMCALSFNNPIAQFSTTSDIINYLRQQWAGLFQRFLRDQQRLAELDVLQEMKAVSGTLHQLISFLTQERENKDEAIKHILLANHPAFTHFAALTQTSYRVFFMNRRELGAWLRERGWKAVPGESRDVDSIAEWENAKVPKKYLKLTHEIFDTDGRLRICAPEEWKDDWLLLADDITDEEPPTFSDIDIPF